MARTYHLYISEENDKIIKDLGVTPSEVLQVGIRALIHEEQILSQELAISYIKYLFELLDRKNLQSEELQRRVLENGERGNETAQSTTVSS